MKGVNLIGAQLAQVPAAEDLIEWYVGAYLIVVQLELLVAVAVIEW